MPSPQHLWVQNLSSQWEGEEQAGQVPVSLHPSLSLPSQCLSAVRTVQSLACLEEADHTVGFILQLSNFMKEWHFHLPQLMRDVQVGPWTWFLARGLGKCLGMGWWALSGVPLVNSRHLERGHFAL